MPDESLPFAFFQTVGDEEMVDEVSRRSSSSPSMIPPFDPLPPSLRSTPPGTTRLKATASSPSAAPCSTRAPTAPRLSRPTRSESRRPSESRSGGSERSFVAQRWARLMSDPSKFVRPRRPFLFAFPPSDLVCFLPSYFGAGLPRPREPYHHRLNRPIARAVPRRGQEERAGTGVRAEKVRRDVPVSSLTVLTRHSDVPKCCCSSAGSTSPSPERKSSSSSSGTRRSSPRIPSGRPCWRSR